MNEDEMREAKKFWPKSKEELISYIEDLVNQQHNYGTCVYAMSLSSVATFNYVASKLGVTGFQASCADLDFIRRVRNYKGSFCILNAEELLYPQYNLRDKLEEWIAKQKDWMQQEATKLIESHKENEVHPNVWKHWRKLASND